MTTERNKLIEAMARSAASQIGDPDQVVTAETFPYGAHVSIGKPLWVAFVENMGDALAAIAEQGYAVVPRRPSPSADTMEYAAVIERDVAGKSP